MEVLSSTVCNQMYCFNSQFPDKASLDNYSVDFSYPFVGYMSFHDYPELFAPSLVLLTTSFSELLNSFSNYCKTHIFCVRKIFVNFVSRIKSQN